MPSRLKSHIILVLDRQPCVARVNCLVQLKSFVFISISIIPSISQVVRPFRNVAHDLALALTVSSRTKAMVRFN